MLAQNFKSAADLDLPENEHDALIKVLGMLERGELRHATCVEQVGEFLFSMATQGIGCGTPACIGGWVAYLLGRNQIKYVDSYQVDGTRLNKLYWGNFSSKTTPEQAAIALRSYLTTGDPQWDLALA